MYSKSYCPYCEKAKNVFKKGDVEVKVYELDRMNTGDAIQKKLKSLSGQSTVPNIYIGGKHIGGCSDLLALESAGKLKDMLLAAGVKNSF